MQIACIFWRVPDEESILAALNAENAEEGKTYFYIYTKDPSVQRPRGSAGCRARVWIENSPTTTE